MSLVSCLVLCAAAPAHADATATAAPGRFQQGRTLFEANDYRRAQALFDAVPADDPSYAWAQLYLKLCQRRLREGVGPEGAATLEAQELTHRLDVLKQENQGALRYRAEHNRTIRQLEDASMEREERARLAWERQARRDARMRARAERLARTLGSGLAHATPPPAVLPAGVSASAATSPAPGGPPVSFLTPVPAALAPASSQRASTSAPSPIMPQPDVSSRLTSWPPPRPTHAQPGAVEVQADRVDYDSAHQRVVASGHVVIDYEGARLTSQQAIVYTESKEAYAEGNACLLQDAQVLVGEILHYNLATRHGQVLAANGTAAPWYFHGPEARQVSAHELALPQVYVTTCEFDPPHYRFQAKRAEVFLDDKIVMHQGVFYVDNIPIFYYPRWTHSFKENQNHVQLIPGKTKQWGPFLLSKWRYELNKDVKGLIHLDWRNNFGWAQGADLKYRTDDWGEGIMRTYYNESTDRMDPKTKPSRFNRHWVELRHRWQIDPQTQATLQFEKFSDTEFRKQFLFRERFTQETTEESYLTVIRAKPNYSLSATVKKRVNRTDGVTEQLPSLLLNINDAPIGDTRLFYQGRATYEYLNVKTAAPSDTHNDVVTVDTFNQLSYGGRLAFINLTPRIGVQQTYFNTDNLPSLDRRNRNVIRGALSSGFDASTRFFRIFDVHTNALGLDINRLRHVINPTVSYSYLRRPTVTNANVAPFGSLTRASTFTLGLEQKLQTKRLAQNQVRRMASTETLEAQRSSEHAMLDTGFVQEGERPASAITGAPEGAAHPKVPVALQSVDVARLVFTLPYDVRPKGGPGSRFGNLQTDLELLPYSWMRIESDATFDNHKAAGVIGRFLTWNLDTIVSGGDRWYVGMGHRYSRNDKTELTSQVAYRLGQKWTLNGYWRYTFKQVAGGAKRFDNLRETQFIVSRDLHDWIFDIVYHVDREFGEEIYFVLHWKAFPDVPFQTKVSYNQPKYGSQSSPFSPLTGQQAP